eukprot:4032484-Amphidinium_carterae.1
MEISSNSKKLCYWVRANACYRYSYGNLIQINSSKVFLCYVIVIVGTVLEGGATLLRSNSVTLGLKPPQEENVAATQGANAVRFRRATEAICLTQSTATLANRDQKLYHRHSPKAPNPHKPK